MNNEIPYRVKDILRLLLVFVFLFMSFSIFSFDSNDILWLTTDLNDPLRNYTGFFGAYLVFFIRFFFGNTVIVLPLILLIWMVTVYDLSSYSEMLKKIIGLFFVCVSLSVLFSFSADNFEHFLYKGGLIGVQIKRVFLTVFGTWGSFLILFFFFLLSLVLTSEFVVFTVLYKMASLSFFYFRRLLEKTSSFLSQRGKKDLLLEKINPPVPVSRKKGEEFLEEKMALVDSQSPQSKGDSNSEKALSEKVGKIEKKWSKNWKNTLLKREKKYSRALSLLSDVLPPIDLLEKNTQNFKDQKRFENREEVIEILTQTFKSFDIEVDVVAVSEGPVITVFEVQPAPGVKINRIVTLSNDIALALSAISVRIVAPIPGKSVIGIEIPNKFPQKVHFRDLIESYEFQKSKSPISLILGKDVAGDPLVSSLDSMPHLLIAGSTGSGKTVCLNTLIMSILYKSTAEEVKMIMIDPKMVEMVFYNGIPHLLTPVITQARRAVDALLWAVSEMERRYEHFADVGVRNIVGYQKRFKHSKDKTYKSKTGEERSLELIPYIVIVVDELADLMMTVAQDVETSICRLAQLSRAVGIHLILATQRPSVNVLTGLIKSNLPCRISFRVASSIDSRTILDSKGAEDLIGKGDMLFVPPGLSNTLRVQGCFLSDEEIYNVVNFLKKQGEAEFVNIFSSAKTGLSNKDRDELYEDAVRCVIEIQQASASLLQRRLRIGYNRASRLIDSLCETGVVSGSLGSKPRKVLFESYEDFEKEGVSQKVSSVSSGGSSDDLKPRDLFDPK